MPETLTVREKVRRVRDGDYVMWNTLTSPLPATDVERDSFEVEGRRGGRYRFQVADPPVVVNTKSGEEVTIERLTVLRPLSNIKE